MKVSELAVKVSELKTEMDGEFAAVDTEFKALGQLIKTEGEATRRHFGAVAEKIVSERNPALDRSMATAQQPVGYR